MAVCSVHTALGQPSISPALGQCLNVSKVITSHSFAKKILKASSKAIQQTAFPGRPVTLAIGANPVLSASLFWEACLLLQYGAEKCEHFNLLSHGDKIMSSNLRACCRSFPIHRKSQSQDGLFLRKQILMSYRSVSFYLWTPCKSFTSL